MMNRLILAMFVFILPFYKADEQPQFKGGNTALTNFLSDKLIYPEYSKQNCITGTIQVSFNIDQAGKVSNVKVYKGLGIDLDDEAIRVVKLTSGQWVVPANYTPSENVILPVRFYSQDARCNNTSSVSISSAIQSYQSYEGLVSAITNYYANKYLGKADPAKERYILSLKEQLGFDDDYADQVMEQAGVKLKQGDHDGACEDWLFVKNIGSDKADKMLAKYCH